MIQAGRTLTGADGEMKAMLICARLYLSYQLLDPRPCADKSMESPWLNVHDRVGLFVLMLGSIVERNDRKLFSTTGVSQLEQDSPAEARCTAPDDEAQDADLEASSRAFAHNNCRAPLSR